jgi:cyclomaltodextrinase
MALRLNSGCGLIILSLAGCATIPSASPTAPTGASACIAPPLGDTTLFLRGTMNGWTPLDAFAFRFSCDAYYLNVALEGTQRFKLSDTAWTAPVTFGGKPDTASPIGGLTRASEPGGAGDLSFDFEGEQTVRLSFENGEPYLGIGAKSFADPRDPPVTDEVALSAKHDSRSAADKTPFGAVPAGTEVAFGLSALPGISRATLVIEKRRLEGNQDVLDYSEVARIPLTRSVFGAQERWQGRYRFAEPSIYGYYFELVSEGKTYLYQNNRDQIYWTREQGSNGVGQIAEGSAAAGAVRRYRLTVHSPDFEVPAWGRDAVYYYIFPDRFRNGDRGNDPKPGPNSYQDKSVEAHANWLDRPWKPGTGDGSDAYGTNDFFGGDIAGIIEKLDYIAELGANTLYITPLFLATSNHKYDTADYRRIDPGFGDDASFTRLTEEAAKRGIRVMPDASLNHSGRDSVYFDRFAKYPGIGAFEGGTIRPDSPYSDWYAFDPGQTDPDKQYTGWAGATDLPELNKNSRSFRDFAYGTPDSVMKLWLDRGAAGWRMDVAPWVPDDFWREWRKAIKDHRPDALLISETWFDSSKYLLGDSFDAAMNYIFRDTVLNYAAGSKARAVYPNIELMRELYPQQSFFALMNLLSTHDTARSLHLLGYEHDGTDPARIADAKRRLRLALFFQMTFPGAPAIFYGDEVGVTGGEDPYNRVTYPWADLGGKPDTALLADFRTLTKLRRDNPVLRHGTIGPPLHIDDHVIVLARQDGPVWAITATNNSTSARSIELRLPDAVTPDRFADALSGHVTPKENGIVRFTVPALYGTVLVGR